MGRSFFKIHRVIVEDEGTLLVARAIPNRRQDGSARNARCAVFWNKRYGAFSAPDSYLRQEVALGFPPFTWPRQWSRRCGARCA